MKRLLELRKEKHMTQTALGLKINVTQNMISFYETGAAEPSIETLIKMSEIFNVSVDYLIGKSDIRYTAESLTADKSEEETELLRIFKTLSKTEQQRAIGILQAVKYGDIQ